MMADQAIIHPIIHSMGTDYRTMVAVVFSLGKIRTVPNQGP